MYIYGRERGGEKERGEDGGRERKMEGGRGDGGRGGEKKRIVQVSWK